MTERILTSLDDLVFDSDGLLPVVVQDRSTQRVLMVAYMTRETLGETLNGGRMVYWSRSRGQRWLKGETSGDVQTVREAYYDCDGDTLLFVVDQAGKGACVTRNFSCFYRQLDELSPVHGQAASSRDL